MTVSFSQADRIAGETAGTADNRLHKPGVAGSSPAAATRNDSVIIDHEPAEVHHSRPGVSASQLKTLALSPVEFYRRHIGGEVSPKTSAAMEYGTLLHSWAEIGEEKFWDVAKRYPDEVLTATGQLGKAAKEFAAAQPEGTILVTPSDWGKLFDQTRQLLGNAAVVRLLNEAVDREFNVQFKWNGHACRCRCDGATASVWYDLKTTKELNPLKTAWRAVLDFHYDIQAAFYGEAAVQCGWPDAPMHFVFTSTVPPYLCCVATLPPEVMHRGRQKCLKLLEELKQRREWNQWLPADYGEVHELKFPEWSMKGGEW